MPGEVLGVLRAPGGVEQATQPSTASTAKGAQPVWSVREALQVVAMCWCLKCIFYSHNFESIVSLAALKQTDFAVTKLWNIASACARVGLKVPALSWSHCCMGLKSSVLP